MRSEFISLAIIITWASILILLERLFPYQKGYKIFREGFWMDFFWYTIVQSYLLSILIAFIIRSIDHSTHITRLHLISGWPMAAQFLFLMVIHEIWQYWFHRLQHRNRYFWRIHEAAHATPEVDWLVGSRSHALEILIAQTFEFAPIILLGAAPEIALMKGTVDAIWGMYNHSNINVRHGWLIYFINGPQLHRWHHAINLPEEGRGVNFSTKLSVWDWIWGTAYLPEDDTMPVYGIIGQKDYPNYDYFKQLWMIFRPFSKDDIPPLG